MRTLLILIVLGFAGSAAAAPACEVKIVRAPDAVRAEIERWIAAETSCKIALEVRIVPTEGGLYILARDDQGEVRERVVPDAQSAGVLIASWAADDRLDRNATFEYHVKSADIEATARDDDDDPNATAIGDHPDPDPTSVVGGPSARPPIGHRQVRERQFRKWMGVFGTELVGSAPGTGLRAELDVWRRGGWTLGFAGSIGRQTMMLQYTTLYGDPDGFAELALLDIKAMAYGARTLRLGDSWHVRAAIGAGLVLSSGTVNGTPGEYPGEGPTTPSQWAVFPTADLSLLVGVELGSGWAIDAGPLVDVFLQRIQTQIGGADMSEVTRTFDVAVVAGLRHTL